MVAWTSGSHRLGTDEVMIVTFYIRALIVFCQKHFSRFPLEFVALLLMNSRMLSVQLAFLSWMKDLV